MSKFKPTPNNKRPHVYLLTKDTHGAIRFGLKATLNAMKAHDVAPQDVYKMSMRQFNQSSSWDMPTFIALSKPAFIDIEGCK